MTLLVKAQRGDGVGEIVRVTPESAGWTYVGFAAHRLQDGRRIDFNTGVREVCIVVLSGIVSVTAGADSWREIGGRRSVFDASAPYAVYVPGDVQVGVVAVGAAEVALCSAPAAGYFKARLIVPE